MERTKCNCKNCSIFCKIMPGYLVPDDIVNMVNNLFFPVYETIESFLEEMFRASPGALVIKDRNLIRINTIVPSRNKNGYCYFLEEDGKCSIHEYSPWGCRMVDSHMTKEEGDKISEEGLKQIIYCESYQKIWNYLNSKNLTSKPPEELRKLLEENKDD